MWLTRLALRNPILILMLSLMTVVLGMQSLLRLSVDLFPDITIPVIRLATFYPGAGPADIEKAITVPVERAVAAAPGVDRVESTSRQGVSIVSAWFTKTFGLPSPPQHQGWPSISKGNHTLIVAPTGSGKTLAAFLWCINHLVEENITFAGIIAYSATTGSY